MLSILAILAALLIPALTGYIQKAKQKALITEATDVWKASQAALSECYALYPESFTDPDPGNKKIPCRFKTTINGSSYTNLGRITNGALGALQKNPDDKTEQNTSSRRISKQVLTYLDSSNTKNATYLFGLTSETTWNVNIKDYLSKTTNPKAVLLQIFHTRDGKVVAINFGKDGYMVTIVPGQEPTCVRNGKSLPSYE